MGIRGSISTMGLPDVFQWLKLGAKTGVLLIDRQARSTQVFFQKGAISDLREPDQAAMVLAFLARGGFPAPESREGLELSDALPQVVRRMAPNRADGSLQQSLLILEEPLREFFIHRLLDLFGWEFGEFSFRDNQTSGRSLLVKPVELEPLMLEWADRTLELGPVRSMFPDSPLLLVQGRTVQESASMGESEKRLLRLSRTPITLHELLARSGLLEFEALKALHRLATAGLMAAQKNSATPSDGQAPGPSESEDGETERKTLWHHRIGTITGGNAPLIDETYRRLRSELASRSDLTGLGPDAIPRMIMRYDAPELMHLKLSQDEGYLLSRIDGQTPLRQLASLSGLSRESTAEVILGLIVRGVLEATGEKGAVHAPNVERAEILLQRALNPLAPKGDGNREVPQVDVDWDEEAAAPAPMQQRTAVAEAHAPAPGPAPSVPLTSSPPVSWDDADAESDADDLFAEALGEDFDSESEPESEPTVEPESPDILSEAVEELERVGSNGASTLLEEAASGADVSATATDPRALSALYAKLGMRALKEHQYGRAITLLTDSLKQDPESSNTWAALAQAYLLEGNNLEEAERCCRRALEGNDWNSRLHLLLGYIQRSREQPDQAAASFFRALELDHTNPQIHEALRSIHLR